MKLPQIFCSFISSLWLLSTPDPWRRCRAAISVSLFMIANVMLPHHRHLLVTQWPLGVKPFQYPVKYLVVILSLIHIDAHTELSIDSEQSKLQENWQTKLVANNENVLHSRNLLSIYYRNGVGDASAVSRQLTTYAPRTVYGNMTSSFPMFHWHSTLTSFGEHIFHSSVISFTSFFFAYRLRHIFRNFSSFFLFQRFVFFSWFFSCSFFPIHFEMCHVSNADQRSHFTLD